MPNIILKIFNLSILGLETQLFYL